MRIDADKTEERKPRGLARPLVYLLVFIAGGIVLLRLDPFGLTRLTKNYSQDLLAVAMAGCYPQRPGQCGRDTSLSAVAKTTVAPPGEGTTRVSVVLLREGDLAFAAETWPPSYRFHARVLKAIRANAPKAVFIDIVFEDERDDPTIAELEAELEQYERKGIRVYAASFGSDHPLRREVRDHVTPVLVPKRADVLDRVTRFYDLQAPGAPAEMTAAAALFRDQCGGCADGCANETIRVFWPAVPDASWNHHWLDCRRRPPFPAWIFQDRGSDFREDCPSTPTVPVKTLLEPEEADDAQIESLLRNGLVLYGANFTGAVDVLNTPLHNDLPGVYLHATALDNLITLGPEKVRYSDNAIPVLGVAWPDLVMLVLVGVFFTLLRTHTGFASRWRAILGRVRFRVVRVLMIVLGSQIGLLFLMVTVASTFACTLGISHWIFGFGVNFLFAAAWTEILDIAEKLFEVADEFDASDD